LKELLTSEPILNIVDPNENFVVCTNPCKEGLGEVLPQTRHAIGYDSRKLKEHERNYAKHDLEISTIVNVVKICMHYLMGKNFDLRIDHNDMKYMFEQPTLNARKTGWLDFLSEYNFDIRNKEISLGLKQRSVAKMTMDALSSFFFL
jgi:hypothetical protein